MKWDKAIKEIEKLQNEYKNVSVMYHEKRHKKIFVMWVEEVFDYENGAGLEKAVQLHRGIINKDAFIIDAVYQR